MSACDRLINVSLCQSYYILQTIPIHSSALLISRFLLQRAYQVLQKAQAPNKLAYSLPLKATHHNTLG